MYRIIILLIFKKLFQTYLKIPFERGFHKIFVKSHMDKKIILIKYAWISDSSHPTSSRCNENNQSRLARQDLLRRRDINLYTGLHPRLLHGQQPQVSPRLSLFSNKPTDQQQQPSRTFGMPCRAFPASVTTNTPQMPSPSFFLQSPCSSPVESSTVRAMFYYT